MRPNTYDDTKAYCLCKILVLPDEITCFSQDVQLLSACSEKFLTVQNDRIFANQNTENPQNFTIQSHPYTKQNMAPDIRITFYVKDRGAYICFNQKWQPRLMKKKNLKDEHSCHFREQMDNGYFIFSSVKDPQKYLGFMKNGRPINYERMRNDEKCRRIFKRVIENSSNDVIIETSTVSSTALGNRKSSSSSRIQQQKTHSNRIDMPKPYSTSRVKSTHHVRHRHDELPLRHPHQHHHHQQQQNNNNNINNIKNSNSNYNDSYSGSSSSSTKHLVNENFNAIYNNPSNNVNSNNISDNNEKVTTHHNIRHQNHRKMHQHPHQQQQQQQTFSEKSPINDDLDDQQQGYVTNYEDSGSSNSNNNNNNINNRNRNPNNKDNKWNKDEIENTNSNNNTSNCSSDDSETDKHLKGKKNVRGRNNNAHANEKQQNNKCNNRKSKKNNENMRHSRKSNQKNSHKINRTPEN